MLAVNDCKKYLSELPSIQFSTIPFFVSSMFPSGFHEIYALLLSYSGDSDDTYDGLYVIDGSIMPCILGVNPAFTIACIAERCMRLLAQDERWTVDYNLQTVRLFLVDF